MYHMNVVRALLQRAFVPIGHKRKRETTTVERGEAVAIYHCSIKIISRGKGKSAVAAAAYRAGQSITNKYDGITHDYTRKRGIVHTEVLLPENAPAEYSDRAILWNAVERIEKAKNSQLAREVQIALPKELNPLQNKALVRDYVKQCFVAQGMCADIAIHDTGSGNPHAHIMLTMRPFEQNGEWGDKQQKVYHLGKDGNKIYDPIRRQYKCNKIQTTDWNDQTKAEEWRAAWADHVNALLERGNHTERIDHRSFVRQGKDEFPTVHLGSSAFQMEKRGIATERGNLNREIEVTNQRLRQLKARIAKLQTWLKEEAVSAEPLSLSDVVSNILSQRAQAGKSDHYQSIANLKAASKLLNFLQENKIRDMAGLEEKVKSMYGKQFDITDKLKPVERRLKILNEHIAQADIYLQSKSLYRQYQQQKPKKQAAFSEKHHAKISLFESAERYLKGVMNGKTTLPIKAWRSERDKLAAEKNRLTKEYTLLKEEIRAIEQIKQSVANILRSRTPLGLSTREWDLEQ